MIRRLRLSLTAEEFSGLVRLCEAEFRSPEDQIPHLLRRELGERKLLSVKGRGEQERESVHEVRP